MENKTKKMSQQEDKSVRKGHRIDSVVTKIINIEGSKMEKVEPKKDEPKKVEPKEEEPKKEEPMKEEPKAEEPKDEEPELELPKRDERRRVYRRKVAPKKLVSAAPAKEEPTGSKSGSSTHEQSERPAVKSFFCGCRDCKLYFGKGNPIECVNPNIVEMRYPKWTFSNNSSAKVPLFRRPADPDSRKDLQAAKRRKR
ncbi:unnamed protein product [Chrysodeixis includens]|uniref:Uncharacterized protein n=1 Tax=Chrysodeixis includens TaxID=689277 RepID=A0A9N8PWU0_CHRIL|nr:unnamed protein product [Chrysodeixis includens]